MEKGTAAQALPIDEGKMTQQSLGNYPPPTCEIVQRDEVESQLMEFKVCLKCQDFQKNEVCIAAHGFGDGKRILFENRHMLHMKDPKNETLVDKFIQKVKDAQLRGLTVDMALEWPNVQPSTTPQQWWQRGPYLYQEIAKLVHPDFLNIHFHDLVQHPDADLFVDMKNIWTTEEWKDVHS